MSKLANALLLSALVLPGSGHFFLKKPIPGAILAVVSIACFYVLFLTSVEIAQELSAKIQAGEIPLDANAIEAAVTKNAATNSGVVSISTYLLAFCWVIGVVDCYRIGRSEGRHNNSK